MKEQLLHAVMHNISVLEMIHLVCVIYMEMCCRSIAENNLLYSYSPSKTDLRFVDFTCLFPFMIHQINTGNLPFS